MHRGICPGAFSLGNLFDRFSKKLIFLSEYGVCKDLSPVAMALDLDVSVLEDAKKMVKGGFRYYKGERTGVVML